MTRSRSSRGRCRQWCTASPPWLFVMSSSDSTVSCRRPQNQQHEAKTQSLMSETQQKVRSGLPFASRLSSLAARHSSPHTPSSAASMCRRPPKMPLKASQRPTVSEPRVASSLARPDTKPVENNFNLSSLWLTFVPPGHPRRSGTAAPAEHSAFRVRAGQGSGIRPADGQRQDGKLSHLDRTLATLPACEIDTRSLRCCKRS